jgi:hypothetical protein
MKMLLTILTLLVVSIATMQGGTSDSNAGYSDGCRTAKGHYTRSAYKYKHSKIYHKRWLRGKRACRKKTVKKHVRKRHATKTTKRKYRSCSSEVPWTAFRRGWNHGNRSAKGELEVDPNGCAAYRQGWVNGYRDCHCDDRRKPYTYAEGYYAGCMSVASVKIRNEDYYRNRSGYHHGWTQGYQDCQGVYR